MLTGSPSATPSSDLLQPSFKTDRLSSPLAARATRSTIFSGRRCWSTSSKKAGSTYLYLPASDQGWQATTIRLIGKHHVQ
jgi:hypothetical protein